MNNVPVIDLQCSDRSAVVRELDLALRTYGFFYVRNHGVDTDWIEGQFSIAKSLFALPLSRKQSMPFDVHLDIGYVGSGSQSLNPDGTVQMSGDTKEQFMMTNNKLLTDRTATIDSENVFDGSQNYHPDVKDHESVTRQYAGAVYKLNQTLNALLFDALDLDSATRSSLGDQPFIVLKQMRYAPDPSDPTIGKFGAGAHTDWGSFTILATDPTPGLQIQMEHEWLPVPPKPGCLIINSGDQIAQLTNNTYRSAMHRVLTLSNCDRFSTAVFAYFGLHAVVEPQTRFVTVSKPAAYPYGRTSTDYFHYKLEESMGAKMDG